MAETVLSVCPVRAHFRELATRSVQETLDFDSSQEDTVDGLAQRLVCGSYCPIVTCAALKALLRSDENRVSHWLKTELEPLIQQDVGSESVIDWNRSVVAKWRLFEQRFNVSLAWVGFDASVEDGVTASYMFSLEALGSYCMRSAAFYSRALGCASCRGEKSKPCSSRLVGHLTDFFPWLRGARDCVFPDFSVFSKEQMAAWSLAVGFVQFGLLGRALGSESIMNYSDNLLQRWQPELERILLGWEEHGVVPSAVSSSPPGYRDLFPN